MADDIMEDYLGNELNIRELSDKYEVHYSNLRRFIRAEMKKRGKEEEFNVQYFNIRDFSYLDLGDTFAFGEGMTIWRVVKSSVKEGDDVWELIPSDRPNPVRHFVAGINTPED